MSAIFGIVHFDGRPVSPASLAALDAALSGWGPDGVTFWRDGSAAIGLRLLASTPEAHLERPVVLPGGGGVVAAARLDNRDDLCDSFGVAPALRPSTPDGALIAMAYERWGTGCPARLLGDWSLAAWDPSRRRLFLARDQLGNTGLHYHQDAAGFAFATTAVALQAVSGGAPSIDDEYLARWLSNSEHDPGRTIWAGVRRVPPAQALTATPDGVRLDRYWSVDEARPVRLPEADYVPAFLERYRRAVRTRLRSTRPIGSTLSAGLDSSSVTALAAEALVARGERLVALTAVPRHPADHLCPGRLADEWPLAQTVAAHWPGVIEHVPIGGEALSPLDSIEAALTALPEPLPAPNNAFWILGLLEQARRRGLGVLLTGQHGNASVSWGGGSWRIAFLLAERRWRLGFEALGQARRRSRVSWPRIVASQVVRPLLQSQPALSWLHRRAELSALTYAMLHPDLVRRFDIPEPDLSPVFRWPPHERGPTLLAGAFGGAIWQGFGAAFGVEIRDPTGDLSLVEFCLGLPDEQVPRALLLRATEGLVPAAIRENSVRGRQAADVVLRLLSEQERVDAEIAALTAHPALAGKLNGKALLDAWHRARAEPGRGATEFLSGLMAAKLLRRTHAAGPLL